MVPLLHCPRELTGLQPPQPHGFVLASGSNGGTVGTVRYITDLIGMTCEGSDEGTVRFPQLHSFVIASRDHGSFWVFARDEIILAVLGQWGLQILHGIDLGVATTTNSFQEAEPLIWARSLTIRSVRGNKVYSSLTVKTSKGKLGGHELWPLYVWIRSGKLIPSNGK